MQSGFDKQRRNRLYTDPPRCGHGADGELDRLQLQIVAVERVHVGEDVTVAWIGRGRVFPGSNVTG